MSNFETLLNAAESYVVKRLSGAELDAFTNAMFTIKEEFRETTQSKKSLEGFICSMIAAECDLLLKRPWFVPWSDPVKYKLLAYDYALDIAESMTKRFSSDVRKW